MTARSEVTDWIKDEWVGYRDNSGAKVWDLYAPNDYTPASYCGAGQGMVAKHFGLDCSPTTHQRIIYVPYVVLDAREAGKWIYSKDSKPGDWVCFCWSGGYHNQGASHADHIGMILSNNPALSYVYTLEFNTTSGLGSGARGCFIRRRDRSFIMGCVDRSHAYSGGVTVPTPPKKHHPKPKKGKLAVDGVVGTQTTIALGAKDGVLSGQPPTIRTSHNVAETLAACWPTMQYGWGGSRAIARLQRKCGVHADGYFGPRSIVALQRHLGVKADGLPGYGTVKALQRALNEGEL